MDELQDFCQQPEIAEAFAPLAVRSDVSFVESSSMQKFTQIKEAFIILAQSIDAVVESLEIKSESLEGLQKSADDAAIEFANITQFDPRAERKLAKLACKSKTMMEYLSHLRTINPKHADQVELEFSQYRLGRADSLLKTFAKFDSFQVD